MDENKEKEHEKYLKSLYEVIKELEESYGKYIPLKALVERFVDVDEEYNHEPWNLLQILANINMIIPVDIGDKNAKNRFI